MSNSKPCDVSNASKRVRLYGQLVDFLSNNNRNTNTNTNTDKNTLDFSSIIFFTPVYFKSITSFLSLVDHFPFKLISKYHDKFYKNENNKVFMKPMITAQKY